MGLVPMPGCPLGTSRKQSRNMRSCWVWSKCARPWAPSLANNLPLLLSEAKETTSQVSCTCCSEPKDQPLGGPTPSGKEPARGQGRIPAIQGQQAWPPPTSQGCTRFYHQSALPQNVSPTKWANSSSSPSHFSGCSPQAGPVHFTKPLLLPGFCLSS